MVRQRALDFSGARLAAIWKQLPERRRQAVVVLWAQRIAAAALRRPKRKGASS